MGSSTARVAEKLLKARPTPSILSPMNVRRTAWTPSNRFVNARFQGRLSRESGSRPPNPAGESRLASNEPDELSTSTHHCSPLSTSQISPENSRVPDLAREFPDRPGPPYTIMNGPLTTPIPSG